jgi:hypothetical protein
MLSKEEVKQIFFYVTSEDPNGIYANEVDVLEYAQKIEAVVSIMARKAEHERCVKIVAEMNREVAKGLLTQVPK